MDHLHPNTRHVLNLSDKEKIYYIKKDKWIGYPRALEVLSEMEDVLDHPPSERMPNLIITSPSNNGKSMIKSRFLQNHKPSDNLDKDAAEVEVLGIGMPPRPDPRRFYMAILKKLFATYSPSDNLARLETQALSIMQKCGVKILIIDDLHNMLAGRIDAQRQFLNMLRTIGIDVQASLICFGTKHALRAIQIDDQLANRFMPYVLPLWKFGKDYQVFLNSYESLLPFKERSLLAQGDVAQYIHAKTEGNIGEAVTLINRAAKKAVMAGKDRVEASLLENCGYISPRDRRAAAEKAY